MTLTTVATFTRRFILIFVVSFVLVISSFIGYKIWYAYYLANLPPIEESPDTRFGILPAQHFPEALVSSSNFSYSLDTNTGGLPAFPKIIKVFFMPKPVASLLSGEKVQQLAEKLGFLSEPEIISETTYKFSVEEKSLIIDLDSANFTFKSEASVSARENLEDSEEQLSQDFKNLLKNLGVLNKQLEDGRSLVRFLKFSDNNLILANSKSEAQGADIFLWPEDIEGLKIITREFNRSFLNSRVVSSANRIENYLSLNLNFWPVDKQSFATYPTKSVENAFNNLKMGQGIVLIEPTKPQVSITSVYIAYFQSENYSPYLQPVFVFEGPEFAAVVSAINQPN